jgi:thioredoxin 1
MKVFMLAFLVMSSLFAEDAMLKESAYKYVSISIGKGKPYFLEVGAKSCASCQIMSKTLHKITQEHPNYNIHFINVAKERQAAHELKVRMIPTQIIFDKTGKEVYRNIGILSSKQINQLLQEHKFEE